MKQIIVDIETNGKISMEAQGFKGQSCEDATRFLENALGSPGKKTHTQEYYLTEPNPDTITTK